MDPNWSKINIMLIDIDQIRTTVLRNCDISDASHAGIYSICTLALRLRDLLKWERGLAPWEEEDPKETLDWIGNKEEVWAGVTETEFLPLPINGHSFDAFDTEAINRVLCPRQLFYGAGYTHGLKPTFFLAHCEKTEEKHGVPVYWLGREMARDLLTVPALTQDNTVLIRKQCARMFFWDQIAYIDKSGRPALELALNSLGIPDTRPASVRAGFDIAFGCQVNGYIHHELGEILDNTFDRNVWQEIISVFPHTPVEFIVRIVKDILADTHPHGTLPWIVQKRDFAGLCFYMAFRGSLTKKLFPDFETRFRTFAESENWDDMALSVEDLRRTAVSHADIITERFRAGKKKNDLPGVQDAIEKQFLS